MPEKDLTASFETFAGGGYHGEVAADLCPPDVEAEVIRLVDPAAATETIHWTPMWSSSMISDTSNITGKRWRCSLRL